MGIKLLIPVPFYVKGGIEQVMVALLREFDRSSDGVVLVLPKRYQADFAALCQELKGVIWEPEAWPGGRGGARWQGGWQRLKGLCGRLGWTQGEQWCQRHLSHHQQWGRLRWLARRHGCTHALYFLTNRLPVPADIGIPVAMVSHDVFWHFAPLTYPPALVQEYDQSLAAWLERCQRVIAVSHKTRQDLLTCFPQFAPKIVAIPSAGDGHRLAPAPLAESPHPLGPANPLPHFYYPSSFSLYKDHLTLLRAAIALRQSGQPLRVTLSGKETDRLAQGDLHSSQQKQTQEYLAYISQCQELRSRAGRAWEETIVGLGYCPVATVEETYQRCDCLVMPSRYEGFGLAIAEAIVRGIPVITSDLAVFREQVDLYGCGDRVKFFPPGDAAALETCLRDFIAHPIPRLSPAAAQARFGHWTWQRVAAAYLATLQGHPVALPHSPPA